MDIDTWHSGLPPSSPHQNYYLNTTPSVHLFVRHLFENQTGFVGQVKLLDQTSPVINIGNYKSHLT